MDSENVQSDNDAADGSHPDSDSSAKPPKYTDDDLKAFVERKLRGQGKALKEAQERLSAYEKAEAERKAAELSTAEKLLAASKALDDANARIRAREEADAVELAEIAEENEAAIKEFPKELRSLIPRDLEPKKLAKWLRDAPKVLGQRIVDVHGGSGRGATPQTDEEKKKAHEASLLEKGAAFVFGSPKKDK